MERSNTLYPYNYEMDCTMYDSVYNKTKKEWLEKQIAKQYDYNINCDSNENVATKKVNEIKK
tara:strand:- start:28 stop:213 length:186 start_codon:yes stop_codon:yes gene_type:complete